LSGRRLSPSIVAVRLKGDASIYLSAMDVTLGPAPSVVALMPTWDYRVVFWEHQLPPEGSGISPDDMGWAELTFTLSDVQDVHEAIEWAEHNIDFELDKDGSGPRGERLYVLYAKVPRPFGGGDCSCRLPAGIRLAPATT